MLTADTLRNLPMYTDPVWIAALLLSALTLSAMVTDATSYSIPNSVCGALLALYPLVWLLTSIPLDPLMGLAAFGTLFAVGYVLFALHITGGGDVKFLACLGLWVGWSRVLLDFVLLMAVIGGLLTLVLFASRRLAPFIALKWRSKDATIPRIFSFGEPLPYGLAIGLAFLIILWSGKLPGLALSLNALISSYG